MWLQVIVKPETSERQYRNAFFSTRKFTELFVLIMIIFMEISEVRKSIHLFQLKLDFDFMR